MNDICQKTYEICNDIIVDLGYEIVDIEYKLMYKENNLTIFIYKKGGVTLADCEKVTKAIETQLDEADISGGKPYNLNISSMGLDRPIVTNDDYRRNLDTQIEAILHNNSKVAGTLIAYDDEKFVLKQKGKQQSYNRADCQIVRPHIKFK